MRGAENRGEIAGRRPAGGSGRCDLL